ncbi:MAG: transcriptional regulator [Parvibaculum sp.]|jgi:ribosome-binding protein aMBF1 (putative translation factor)|nr:transcriptional regulator [Parvibaculum sp.]
MTKLSELKKRWIKDPEFRTAYEEADVEYRVVEALIEARSRAHLSQTELAKRIGTTQSAIARLESGQVSPTITTLKRYAAATGSRLVIDMLPVK